MELKTELHVIRRMMIVTIVSCTVGLALLFTSYPESTNNIVLGTKIAVSGFGDITLFNPDKVSLFSSRTYQDAQLGFQVSKPGDDWDIHSAVDEIDTAELALLKTKGFLDGLYVEQSHDKRFMITVFDIQKENLSLHEFVDQQISLVESQRNATVVFEQVSPENDWALFALESYDESKQYDEQLLFLKEGRLYMLQYSGESPQVLSSDQKNDFKFILDSFEVI